MCAMAVFLNFTALVVLVLLPFGVYGGKTECHNLLIRFMGRTK